MPIALARDLGERQEPSLHLRVYAESELLGPLTPGHTGADLWRAHRLRASGLDRPAAFADVALDRLIGGVGLTVFVVIAGATLPSLVLMAEVGLAALVGAFVVRRHRPQLLTGRPWPRPRPLVDGLLLSLGYQLTILGLLLGGLAARGHTLPPLALLGVFGGGQVARMVPGVHGGGPKEGTLVAGLIGLGVPFGSAPGAVSIVSLAAWAPALILGGGCLLVRRLAKQWPEPLVQLA